MASDAEEWSVRIWFPAIAFILCSFFGPAQQSTAAVPVRPDDFIFDPLEIWSVDEKKNLTSLSKTVVRERGYTIYFAAIGAPETTSADEMAEELRTVWLPRDPGAVFVTLIDRPGLGLAISSEKKRPADEKVDDVRLYLFSNRRTPASATILQAAANQLVSDLTFKEQEENVSSEAVAWTLQNREVVSIIGGILVLVAGFYVLKFAHHSNFFGFQKRFPSPKASPRLGGTNSGGAGVMIDFGSNAVKPEEAPPTEY